MRPESEAETNQEGLAYGFAIKRDELEVYWKCVYEHVSAQRKKGPTRNYKWWLIIYQSDGNSETVDHAEARDQPKSFTTTIFQFQSSQDIYDFGQIKVFGQVFLVFISC